MRPFRSLTTVCLLGLCLSVSPWADHTQLCAQLYASPNKAKVSSPIKRLINAIRYEKDELALKSFDGQAQGVALFGSEVWAQQPAEQQARFIKVLHGFFSVVAFPKLRKDFEHLETILYAEPAEQAEGALKLRATIVVLHALKKDEIPVDFLLKAQKDGAWLISDFWIAPSGEAPVSFLSRLKTDQVGPLLAKEGWEGLLSAMEKRVAELKKR